MNHADAIKEITIRMDAGEWEGFRFKNNDGQFIITGFERGVSGALWIAKDENTGEITDTFMTDSYLVYAACALINEHVKLMQSQITTAVNNFKLIVGYSSTLEGAKITAENALDIMGYDKKGQPRDVDTA